MFSSQWHYNCNFYHHVFPGLYFGFPDPFQAGFRLPIGIATSIHENVQLFGEIAPTWVFYVSNGAQALPSFRIQIAAGIMYHFK